MTVPAVAIGILNSQTIEAVPDLVAYVEINGVPTAGAAIIQVTLTESYEMLTAPGLPNRPPAGSVFSDTWSGMNFAPGDLISVYAFEGAAILAAGGGALA
ncbi:hypothetical protein ACOSOMT5_P0692 [Acidiphilium sp. MT5]